MSQFDIIIFLETWQSKPGLVKLIGYDKPIEKIVEKRTKFGHNPGGIMVFYKLKMAKHVTELRSRSNSLLWLKINFPTDRGIKMVIICAVYLHPEGSKYANPNVFTTLEEEIVEYKNLYPNAVIYLVGDFNARSGQLLDTVDDAADINHGQLSSNYDSDIYTRKNKDATINRYGDLLCSLCKTTDMLIVNGRHEGDQNGEVTFINQNGKSTVDYLLTEKHNLPMIKSFEIASRVESCHLPLNFEIVLYSYATNKNTSTLNVFNVVKYKWNPERAEAFSSRLINEQCRQLINKCNASNDIPELIETIYDILYYCGDSYRVKYRNLKSKNTQGWFTLECETAKHTCRKLLNKYRQKNTEESRVAYVEAKNAYNNVKNQSKREYDEKERNEFIKCIQSRDSKTFWSKIKSIRSNKQYIENQISPETWYTHFNKLLNIANNTEIEDTDFTEANLELDSAITLEEISKVINGMKKQKSPGPDGIPVEFISNHLQELLPLLHKIFNTMYNQATYPSEWTQGLIVPIYKGGDPNEPNNYRPITLSDSLSKVFCGVLCNRLVAWTNTHAPIAEGQAGFRENYSTIDNIFVLDTVINKTLQRPKSKLYCIFVDFKKAFDSVPRALLWRKMCETGFNGKMMRMLQAIYRSVKCAVLLPDKTRTSFFESTLGLKQGCILSPFLFSLYINDLETHLKSENLHAISVEDEHLFYLLFADDLTLFSNTVVGLQRLIDRLQVYCSAWRITVNVDKTKVVVFRKGGILSKKEKWFYNGSQIQVVPYFKYLGVTFSSTGKWVENCKMMAERGQRALNYIRSVRHKLSGLPVAAMSCMFDTMVIPAMLYGGEIWGYEKCPNIESVQAAFCRMTLGLPKTVPNCVLRAEMGRNSLKCKLYVKMIRWWLRVMDMPSNRFPKKCLQLQFKWADQDKDCWGTKLKLLLYSVGMGHAWMFGVGDRKMFTIQFNTRITDINNQELLTTIQDMSMLRVYKLIKTVSGEEAYTYKASSPYRRSAVARLRGNGLYINVHIGRRQGIPLNERTCVHCSKCIEDEFHILFICPLYNNIRKRYIPGYYTTHPSYAKMILLLNSQNEGIINSLATFIMTMERLRSIYIEWTTV